MKSIEGGSIGVGVIGAGTVGGGVIDQLKERREDSGLRLERVAVRDLKKHPEQDVPFTEDVLDIFNDPKINIVVELAGGTGDAKDYVFDSISKDKSVVTANKALMSRFSRQFFEAATSQGVDLRFEASVGAGIPIINTLESYRGERIDRVMGILNGTSNFVLSRIEEGMSFDEAVRLAQEKGFAEADHSLDTGGFDSRDKLGILASLIYNSQFDPEEISCTGITDITPADLDFARRYEKDENGVGGYVVKLLAIADKKENGVELRVNPALIRSDHPLAAVNEEYNAVYLEGQRGPQLMTGQGAGREATASAVVSDINHVARNLRLGVIDEYPTLSDQVEVIKLGEVEKRGYIRTKFRDEPGRAVRGLSVLAKHGLNVEDSIQQKKYSEIIDDAEYVPDFITVDSIAQRIVEGALVDLYDSDRVAGKPVYIPIEMEQKESE